jgi:hypothetical protein
VIDIDTDTPEAHAYVEKHFGASTVQVKSPRGVHHYFNLPEGASVPKNIRQDGIAIDFKHGANSYVSGPLSKRPDGGEYIPIVGILGKTKLPIFKAKNEMVPYSGTTCKVKPSPLPGGRKVGVGQRNDYLMRKAVSYVQCLDNYAELLDELKAQREYDCDDLESIPDSELIGIAEWAWGLRTSNSIFSGRNSGVIIRRDIMDKLLCLPYGQNAFALLCILEISHGHIPGKRFCIDPAAMKKNKLISFGRNVCFHARDLLIEQKLIKRIGGYKPGSHAQHYQLMRAERV